MKRSQVVSIAFSAAAGGVIGALAVTGKLHSAFTRFPALGFDPVVQAHRTSWIATIAGWIILSLYWEYSARKAAEAKSSESTPSRGVHVFLVSLAQALVLLPIRGLGRFLPAWPFLIAAGLVIEAAGVFLAWWARSRLGRNWSGRIAVKVDHELIRTGPYKYLRHPIYTGLLAMYVGPTLVTGERLAAIGVVVAALAYWRKISLEEATLQQSFGEQYQAYRRDTWALVPGLF